MSEPIKDGGPVSLDSELSIDRIGSCEQFNWSAYEKAVAPRPYLSEDKPQPERKPMVNLGCANGWGKDPDIVVACNALKHRTESVEEARCLTRVTCRTCGYSYTYDSSD